jgi:dCMP deaminase
MPICPPRTPPENDLTTSQEKWDIRFLKLARHISAWSKDPSTQTGAVITHPNRTVLSMGFNGFAQNMSDNPELYLDRETKYSRIIHCEINALLLAEGSARGCTLYTWPFASCDRCAVQMLQAGISHFVYPSTPDHLMERWGKSFELTKSYFIEAGVTFTEIPFEKLLD